jgi:broad specificity phosphatase PhoE
MPNRSVIWKAACVLAATVIVGACGGTPQARSITLTFIRNAQSQANADGVIDTSDPGPSLTTDGKSQAQQLSHQHNDFDSVYSSTMAEAQQTATAVAGELGKQVEIVSGLQSLGAGRYNGKPESMSSSTYMLAPSDWLNGDTQDSVPDGISGQEFNSRFSAAVRKIYDSGHSKPVAFSQGTAIMIWTLMNVKNPKTTLLSTHPLPNTGRIVISGNPSDGWTLVDWDGVRNFTG